MRRTSAVLIVVALLLAGRTLVVPVRAEAVAPPNFVLILTDDQRWDTIGRCLGGFDGADIAAGAGACMPHLQQELMANGSTFFRGYVTTALCCPSRASLLTGRYARHTGVKSNSGFFNFDDSSTIATWLHDAGYRTGYFGKYLNGYGDSGTASNYIPPGWDSWHAFWRQADYTKYSLVEREPGGQPLLVSYDAAASTSGASCAAGNYYSTDLLCSQARGFLAADPTTPFFMHLAPYSPHLPPSVPSRHEHSMQGLTTPTYPNHNVAPAPNPPSWVPSSPIEPARLSKLASEFRKQILMNLAVDDAVDSLVEQLRADGRLDRTVFMFSSDNGFARGEHRWDGKRCEYEECHRIPFVVACPPAVCPGAVGGTAEQDALVLNIDIAPTLADLAGIPLPTWVDGTSLVPLLNGTVGSWRSSFLLEDPFHHDALGITADLSDGHTYKYVELLDGSEVEMYDLTEDPWELMNLAGDGVHSAVEEELAAAMHAQADPPLISLLAGPEGPVSQSTVTFEWTTDEPASFECALDGGPAVACGSGTGGAVTYSGLPEGAHSFVLHATDDVHNTSSLSRSFSVDVTAPTVTMKKPTVDELLASRTVSALWSGKDNLAVTRYELFEQQGLSGLPVLVQSSPALSYTRMGELGATYCYQAKAFDAAGNTGTGAIRCGAVPYDDVSAELVYAGGVTHTSAGSAFEGTLSVLDGPGQRVDLSFDGRKWGVLARKDPSSGKVQVWVDGLLFKTVDLYSATLKDKVFIHTQTLARGPHAVALVWAGTKNASSSGTAINLDGIAVIG